MKKVLDQLLDVFIWIYERFLYSLAFGLFLGASVALGQLSSSFVRYLRDSSFGPVVYVLLSIFIGIKLKSWRDSRLENKK